MNELGAYIQLFKNDGKGELMICSFRHFYPAAPIYLVSDGGGDDFSNVASKYNCFYYAAAVNTGVKNHGFNKGEMLVWLDRMKNAFEYCATEYLLYMEDDVFVRGMINIDKNNVLSGVQVGDSIPDDVINYLRGKYNTQFNHKQGGACGGTLYKTEVFLSNYQYIIEFINNDFDILQEKFINFGCLDQTMPIIYTYLGYQYDKNHDLIETGRNNNWRQTKHPIVHINGNDESIFEEVKRIVESR